MKSFLVWFGLFVLLYLCFSNDKPEPEKNIPESTYIAPPSPTPIVVETVQAHPATQLYGYECTVDCSGHEAGRNWAEEKGIDDPDDCGGNSQSFIEGCQSYAEEQKEENESTQSE